MPQFTVDLLPGAVYWAGSYRKSRQRPEAAPPFELRGKLAQIWEQSKNGTAFACPQVSMAALLVPTSISAQERATLLASVPDPTPPATPAEVDETPPAEG